VKRSGAYIFEQQIEMATSVGAKDIGGRLIVHRILWVLEGVVVLSLWDAAERLMEKKQRRWANSWDGERNTRAL
jgi:hypothetical protein